MDSKKNLPERKADHIRINLEHDVSSDQKNGLDDFQFVHQALPEIDLAQVTLQTQTLWESASCAIPDLIDDRGNGRGITT